jgi:hypothetical protein
MASPIVVTKKKRGRGRPPTGIGPHVGLRLYPDLQARLDAWIDQQGEPELGRPEAIRRLLDQVLPELDTAEPHTGKPRRPVKRKDDSQ